MSPSEFHEVFARDEQLSTAAKHFRILEELDCIELVDEKTRRAAAPGSQY
jgi:hypothetical protein